MPETLAAPKALAAFLKGIERRAAVLAELQAGDAGIGDAALTRAMAAFRPPALAEPIAAWPRLFWTTLLGQAALRHSVRARSPGLPPLPPGLRAVLLLRLVGGLDPEDIAAVLGVAPGTVLRGLERAAPRTDAGDVDGPAWSRMREGLQGRVRELPTPRSLRLARAREAALAGTAERFFPAPPALPWRALAAVGMAVAAALGATVLWPVLRMPAGVEVAPLPAAKRPASRFDATAALVSHPDFALLADPATDALAADLAFLSWSAGATAAPVADATGGEAAAIPVQALPAPLPESLDAP